MHHKLLVVLIVAAVCGYATSASAQRVQFPQQPSGLRPIDQGGLPSTGSPMMVPINPSTQNGVYPSAGLGNPMFDPYANSGVGPGTAGAAAPFIPPGNVIGGSNFGGATALGGQPLGGPTLGGQPYGVQPGLAPPTLPGTGQSGIVGTFPNTAPNYNQPGIYPNSAPSALFPGAYPNTNSSGPFGGFFNNLFGGMFGSNTAYPQPTVIQPNYNGGVYPPPAGSNWSQWNPQGSVFTGQGSVPQFIRLFQGPRFRHGFVHGNNDADALMINDTDVAVAMAFPNFLYSTQPLYLLPSFSLHQWDGPHPAATADLPALAYSAFLDAGWQSDPARILGAELGVRVGMFTDFDTANSDSLRVMGRGIGRLRLTPRATLKLGVIYLDRNKVKLLPAGGLLWQPNPETRFDLFFPEPKLAHYLSTVGNTDSWWYVGGYYGGGSWTVTRADTSEDSIDINDLRLVLGIEWGRNDQMRQGRRLGFFEVGYVFDRELLYKTSPIDNLSLQDTIMVRAGFGY